MFQHHNKMPMKIDMTKRWKTRSNPFSVKYPVAKHNSINTQNSLINSTWYIYVSASNPIYIIKFQYYNCWKFQLATFN